MIYISGRITKNKNWERDFKAAENWLIKKGYKNESICNPLKLSKQLEEITKNPTYRQYMRRDIRHLMNYCDGIYMLRGWWRSKGARLEWHVAKVLGLEVIYQKRKDVDNGCE